MNSLFIHFDNAVLCQFHFALWYRLIFTGEPLKITKCSCKGSMQISHRSCLIEWIRRRRSNRCEICTAKFDGISPPLSRELSRQPPGDRNILATVRTCALYFRFVIMVNEVVQDILLKRLQLHLFHPTWNPTILLVAVYISHNINPQQILMKQVPETIISLVTDMQVK